MRLLSFISLTFFLLLFASCQISRTDDQPKPAPPERPVPAVLSIILKADPALDTLTIADILRAPGTMREDYPRTISAPPDGHLLFSFLGPEDRILRQTSLPYPGPNRYEVPSEDGHIEDITVPEAERILLLRTNFSPALRRLQISGQTPSGRRIDQSVDLGAR